MARPRPTIVSSPTYSSDGGMPYGTSVGWKLKLPTTRIVQGLLSWDVRGIRLQPTESVGG